MYWFGYLCLALAGPGAIAFPLPVARSEGLESRQLGDPISINDSPSPGASQEFHDPISINDTPAIDVSGKI